MTTTTDEPIVEKIPADSEYANVKYVIDTDDLTWNR